MYADRRYLQYNHQENQVQGDQYQSQRVILFQKFIDALRIKERVQENNCEINMTIQKQGSSLTLSFVNGRKYIFECQQSSLNRQQDQSDLVSIIQNDLSFSLMNVFLYYYSKNQNSFIFPKNDLESNVCKYKKDFIDLSNHFMKVLDSKRRYSNYQSVSWQEWNTYWSKKERKSFCFSNCSGVCNEQCEGAQCLYFFPQNELQNPYIPDKERADTNNIFDDQKYWIAELFNQFVKDEKDKFEHFFLYKSQNLDDPLRQNQNNLIAVEIATGDILELNQLNDLYQISKEKIISISILFLNSQSVPKGEGERQKLYEFILSLPNLNSLELQLEHSLYHTDEENYQIPEMQMYSVPVNQNVVANFTKFLLKLKVKNLSLLLDEQCYPVSIDLQPIISSLPKLNQNLKDLHISINHRRMHKANEILQNLCSMQQLQWLTLDIKKQWSNYHSTCGFIQEDFAQWELKLKNSCKSLKTIIIN